MKFSEIKRRSEKQKKRNKIGISTAIGKIVTEKDISLVTEVALAPEGIENFKAKSATSKLP